MAGNAIGTTLTSLSGTRPAFRIAARAHRSVAVLIPTTATVPPLRSLALLIGPSSLTMYCVVNHSLPAAGEPQRRRPPGLRPRLLHLGRPPAAGRGRGGLRRDRDPADAPERGARGGLGADGPVGRALRSLLDGRLPRRQPPGAGPSTTRRSPITGPPSSAGWARTERPGCSA